MTEIEKRVRDYDFDDMKRRRLDIISSATYKGAKRFAVYHPDHEKPVIVAAPTGLAALIRAAEYFGYTSYTDPVYHDLVGLQKL